MSDTFKIIIGISNIDFMPKIELKCTYILRHMLPIFWGPYLFIALNHNVGSNCLLSDPKIAFLNGIRCKKHLICLKSLDIGTYILGVTPEKTTFLSHCGST